MVPNQHSNYPSVFSPLPAPCFLSQCLQCWWRKWSVGGQCSWMRPENPLVRWIIKCLSTWPAQHCTARDHICSPTFDSKLKLDLLAPFGTFSYQEHSLWYVHLHGYLNKSRLVGSVAESSLKTLHRLLLASSRLAAAKEVNHECIKYGRVVWSHITPGSVESCL